MQKHSIYFNVPAYFIKCQHDCTDVVSGSYGSEFENFEPQKQSRSDGLGSWLTEYQTKHWRSAR